MSVHIGALMFRVSFHLTDTLGDPRDWARELRSAAPVGVLIYADFLEAKTVEAYIEIDDDVDIHAVSDLIAQRLGFNEYEVAAVERLGVPAVQARPAPARPPERSVPAERDGDRGRLLHVHPAAITRVLVRQPDERELNVQVRHRQHETIDGVAVKESDDAVEIEVSVGTLEPDTRVSLAVSFSWIATSLARPLAGRRINRRQ